MLRLTVLGLLVVNWLLAIGQYVFFNGGSFFVSKNSFTAKIAMLANLNSSLNYDALDDFNHYMGFESKRCVVFENEKKGKWLTYSATWAVFVLIWATFVALFCMFLGMESLLNLFAPVLAFLLVTNLILLNIEVFRLIRYYNTRHKKQIEPILDFLFPNGEQLFDKLSFTAQEKAELYRVYRLIMLDQSDFKIVYADLLNNGQLFDRIDVATNLLKRTDAKKLIARNKKLEKEIKSTYFDLMDVLLSGLNKVSDLRKKQVAIDKNLEKLKEQTTSNDYVNRFAVIKELHRKN